MSKAINVELELARRPKIETYWIIIGIWAAALAVLFGYHLWTNEMPSAEAFSLLGLPVYWYGILIVGGIGLGAFVVSRLAWERWRRTFLAVVPDELMTMPVTAVSLPTSIQTKLNKQGVQTVGELLLLWGAIRAIFG
jgi:hypothetical protein